MRQKVKELQKSDSPVVKVIVPPECQELGIQCDREEGSTAAAIASSLARDSSSEQGLTSFLKDRYDQLKTEMDKLGGEKSDLERQAKSLALQFKELNGCVQTMKHATVKQFINKNHVELDMEENDGEPDLASMIDIVQTVT